MQVRAEFTTEPFSGEGELPEHVTRSAAVLTAAGLTVDLGPFGTSVEGEEHDVLSALGDVLVTAFTAGAERITLQVERR